MMVCSLVRGPQTIRGRQRYVLGRVQSTDFQLYGQTVTYVCSRPSLALGCQLVFRGTHITAIPAIFIGSLSAWLAYLALRRRNMSRNDIEALAIELIVARTSTTTSSTELHPLSSQMPSTILTPCENMPQPLPTAVLRDCAWVGEPPQGKKVVAENDTPISEASPFMLG
ncbi:hypothetical protein NXS19_000333 [Fusarium pseudograminearum]|nr:hypothetical protein NXS19_000333 [Fusarium pseudograminearum]